MKIAIATDDKINIAEHFGSSRFILVVTIENCQVVGKEFLEKPGHSMFSKTEPHPPTDNKGRHGFGDDAELRHGRMFDLFRGCEALIVNKIGTGAYTYFSSSGVKVIATDTKDVDEAILLYSKEKLQHKPANLD